MNLAAAENRICITMCYVIYLLGQKKRGTLWERAKGECIKNVTHLRNTFCSTGRGHWVRRLHFPVVRLLLKMIESSQMRKPRLTTRKLCCSSASKTCIWDGKMKPSRRAAAQASGEGAAAAGAKSLRPALSVCIFCTRNLNVSSSSSFHFLLPRFPAGPKTFLSVRHHLSGERRWLGPPDFALSLSFPLFLSGI